MARKSAPREDEFGFKTSSGVNYNQVLDRQIEDERFQRQRALREGSAAPAAPVAAAPKAGAPSATMDAVMRMLTGKEERTIADRISDPNRPTWEQYKKENADKLDLTDDGAKEMREYRKQLDAARKKAFSKRSGSSSKKSKKNKKSYSSSSSDSDSGSDSDGDSRRRSSSRKSRKKSKKSRKRRRASSSDSDASDSSSDDSASDREDDERRRGSRRHGSSSRKSSSSSAKKSKKKSHKKHKKSERKSADRSPSPADPVVNCFFMPPHLEASPLPDNEDAPHHMEPEETSAAVREKRAAFMQLLRAGVRAKLQSPGGDQLQADTASTGAWRALAWRNAYALEPFFQETVCGRALRVKQLLQGELTGFGTGLTVWPAACLLLKHLEYRYAMRRDESTLHDKLVVELGSGTGAVGIAAAMLGAGRVVLTDVQKILFLMEENVRTAQELCGSRLLVDVEAYEWGAPPSARLLRDDGSLPDVVLISDCILPRLYPIEPLVDALDCLCGPHTTVLISYEPRYYALFDPKIRFWELLRKKNFAIREIGHDLYHPHYRADDIEVWEAKRVET